ncbi:MAG TPA: DUF3048 C-terminal domain-containing protein [Anaerolineaceae bacterium]|nr:DUF3048 C-terminal domain-containing protein [Anaerolineaceae bacterium]
MGITRVLKLFLWGVLVVLLSSCTILAPAPKITPLVTELPTTPTLNPEQALTKAAQQATPTPLPTSTPWQVATPTATQIPFSAQNDRTNPLTGLKVFEPNLLFERPIMVKLANWPQSLRPFNQIIDADIVFEYYIGYQMNHLLALYYGGDAAAVGPLAPGRLVDARLARRYQASLVVTSAPPTVEGVFEQTLPDRVFYRGYAPCPGICTETESQGGNTVVNTAAMRTFIESEGISTAIERLPDFYFDKKIENWDENALRLSYLYADFSVMDWRYDKTFGGYQLWQDFQQADGSYTLQQTFDRDSGQQVIFENVLILLADYIEYNPSFYDIDFREGDREQAAILLRDGKLTHGTWYAPDINQPFQFFDLQGNPYYLKPGRTWITFASTTSRVDLVDEGSWDLIFIPN